MNKIITITKTILIGIFLAGGCSLFVSQRALADQASPLCVPKSNLSATPVNCNDVPNLTNANQTQPGNCYYFAPAAGGGSGQTATQADCSQLPGFKPITNQEKSSQPSQAQINKLYTSYINPFVNFLSAGIGIVVTIMIVIGGIQYSASGGNPQAVEAAKKRIFNALIALLLYALLFAFLQWVIPGGL